MPSHSQYAKTPDSEKLTLNLGFIDLGSIDLLVRDGFYSNRYTWLSGSLAYTNGPHTLSFVAGGNLGQTKLQSLVTPVQNNGSIYNVIYTYSRGSWIIQPYFQYTDVPTNAKIGVVKVRQQQEARYC